MPTADWVLWTAGRQAVKQPHRSDPVRLSTFRLILADMQSQAKSQTHLLVKFIVFLNQFWHFQMTLNARQRMKLIITISELWNVECENAQRLRVGWANEWMNKLKSSANEPNSQCASPPVRQSVSQLLSPSDRGYVNKIRHKVTLAVKVP